MREASVGQTRRIVERFVQRQGTMDPVLENLLASERRMGKEGHSTLGCCLWVILVWVGGKDSVAWD